MLDRSKEKHDKINVGRVAGAASAPDCRAPRGRVLREPSAEDLEGSNITRLLRWLAANKGLHFSGYPELWQWSISERDQFWAALWDYFEIEASEPFECVARGSTPQDVAWFPGARLNFAQHLLRHEARLADQVALSCYSEGRFRQDWLWSELGTAVRSIATGLRELGIGPGDRVAAYLPNTASAAVAMLAVTAIGAVWSSCSPEFGAAAAVDRFGQIEPKLLFAIEGYRFAGVDHDRRMIVRDIVDRLPSLEHVVLVPDAEQQIDAFDSRVLDWRSLLAASAPGREAFQFEQMDAGRPLWIVFTSGTTGAPKAIVHSHVGALMGALKDLHFHIEVSDRSVLFFYCTTSWIVWNLTLAGLSLGARVVTYDGSPFHPGIGRLWSIAEETGSTVVGASPGFVSRMIEKDYLPVRRQSLASLETVVLSGGVVEPHLFEWLTTALPRRTRIISQAGSTEICGGYAGGVRVLPTRAGELPARMLGMDVQALNARGEPVRNEAGELVICSLFPNAPSGLWNDPTGERLFDTYFSLFPGKWRQGDLITIFTDGACRVSGRSDATIKRHGIRIGSSEIYRSLADTKQVTDAIAVCPQVGANCDRLVLFVRMASGQKLDDDARRVIAGQIAQNLSPRHVPDMIVEAPAIPYTATGKRVEVPLRLLLEGEIDPAAFMASLQHDPEAAKWYAAFAHDHQG